VQKIHPKLGEDWAVVFDLKRAAARREGTGMPGPATGEKTIGAMA